MSVPHHIRTNTKNITEWEGGQCHAYDGSLLTSNRSELHANYTQEDTPNDVLIGHV